METSPPSNAAVARIRELMESDPGRYGTQSKLASLTGLDQKSWSTYLRGKRTPGRLARAQIQRKLHVAPGLWDVAVSNAPSVAA